MPRETTPCRCLFPRGQYTEGMAPCLVVDPLLLIGVICPVNGRRATTVCALARSRVDTALSALFLRITFVGSVQSMLATVKQCDCHCQCCHCCHCHCHCHCRSGMEVNSLIAQHAPYSVRPRKLGNRPGAGISSRLMCTRPGGSLEIQEACRSVGRHPHLAWCISSSQLNV